MPKLIAVLAFLLASAFAFATTASAGPEGTSAQQSKRPDGSFTLAQNWNDRVCCKRGNRDWWTTWRACRNAGGHQARNWECRNDGGVGPFDLDLNFNLWTGGRICCKRGYRDWWTTWGECRRLGGHRVHNRQCRDDSWWRDHRVCCQWGRQDFWSSQRECYRRGGYETHNRYCRDDYDNDPSWGDYRDHDGGYDDGGYDNDGDWNRRVCCKRGRQDWWTTWGQCRQAGGEIDRTGCRNE